MINEVDERGEPIKGDTLLLLLNAHWEEIPFTLPDDAATEHVWETLVDTRDAGRAAARSAAAGEQYPLYGRSLALLRTTRPAEAGAPASQTQVEAMRREARKHPQPSPKPSSRLP